MRFAHTVDERARKPVFAVVLMVAVTLLLFGTTGYFLMDTERPTTRAPQASFEVGVEGSRVTVVHVGGETFDRENTGRLEVVTTGGTVVEGFDVSDGVGVGDRAVVRGIDPGDVVRVVWHGPDEKRGSVLVTYEVP